MSNDIMFDTWVSWSNEKKKIFCYVLDGTFYFYGSKYNGQWQPRNPDSYTRQIFQVAQKPNLFPLILMSICGKILNSSLMNRSFCITNFWICLKHQYLGFHCCWIFSKDIFKWTHPVVYMKQKVIQND